MSTPTLTDQARIDAILEDLQTLQVASMPATVPTELDRLIRYDDDKHRYWIDGVRVPSVTQILGDTQPKPALTWWGFRVGMSVIVKALLENKLTWGELSSWSSPEAIIKPVEHELHPDILRDAKRNKLRSKVEQLALDLKQHPNAIKEERGTVGTSIHVAAEQTMISGALPNYADYPEADRGYVQALARWYVDTDPEPVEQEVIVASERYGFAGRFDLERRNRLGDLVRADFKTSHGIYEEFHLQLSLYDLAAVGMDRGQCAFSELIHLRPDGTYAVIPVAIDHARALCCVLAYWLAQPHRDRIKALES